MISAGYITADTINTLNTSIDIWKFSPLVFLCGLCLWVFERAKGTNISKDIFYTYESVLVVCIMYSIVWSIVFGSIIDLLFNTLLNLDIVKSVSMDLNPIQTATNLIKVMYLVIQVPAYLGSFLFAIHPIIEQTDSMIYSDDTESSSDEYVSNFQQI
jgi:hypothetical protein